VNSEEREYRADNAARIAFMKSELAFLRDHRFRIEREMEQVSQRIAELSRSIEFEKARCAKKEVKS